MGTISPHSSSTEKATAAVTISQSLEDVIKLVDDATMAVGTNVADNKESLRAVKGLVVELVKEIGYTLRGVVSVLPINVVLKPHVKRLLKSLMTLVKPIGGVVSGLLDTVHGLLDSILGGLNLGELLDSVRRGILRYRSHSEIEGAWILE